MDSKLKEQAKSYEERFKALIPSEKSLVKAIDPVRLKDDIMDTYEQLSSKGKDMTVISLSAQVEDRCAGSWAKTASFTIASSLSDGTKYTYCIRKPNWMIWDGDPYARAYKKQMRLDLKNTQNTSISINFKEIKNFLQEEPRIIRVNVGGYEYCPGKSVLGSVGPKQWLGHKDSDYAQVYCYAADSYFRVREDIEQKLPGFLERIEHTPLSDKHTPNLDKLLGSGTMPQEGENNQN